MDPQGVRPIGQFPAAQPHAAVLDPAWAVGRRGLERVHELAHDHGAGRRRHLALHAACADRHALKQQSRRRRRHRHHAMPGPDRAAAHHDGGARHARRSEVLDGERGADQVDDRVVGADFVEVHLIQADPVHARLRLAQTAEESRGPFPRAGSETAPLDHAEDRGQAPMRGALAVPSFDRSAVSKHAEAHASQPSPLRPPHLQLDAVQAQPLDHLLEQGNRQPQVQAGAQEHVARDAARTVHVEQYGASSSHRAEP